MNQDQRRSLLREASQHVADEHGIDVSRGATVYDSHGRVGFALPTGPILVAKRRRFEGRLSVSRAVLKRALPDRPIAVYEARNGRVVVFDPVTVAEARAGTVDSKQADDVAVREVPARQGEALGEWLAKRGVGV